MLFQYEYIYSLALVSVPHGLRPVGLSTDVTPSERPSLSLQAKGLPMKSTMLYSLWGI